MPVKATSAITSAAQRIEELTTDLFKLHDLKKNGVIEEGELIKLNQKIALLHHGKDTDLDKVADKFRGVFRDKLDARGEPVTVDKFRAYILQALRAYDSDPRVQEMIVDQWVMEAESARAAFYFPEFRSVTDAEFIRDWTKSGGDYGSITKLEEVARSLEMRDSVDRSSKEQWLPPTATPPRPQQLDSGGRAPASLGPCPLPSTRPGLSGPTPPPACASADSPAPPPLRRDTCCDAGVASTATPPRAWVGRRGGAFSTSPPSGDASGGRGGAFAASPPLHTENGERGGAFMTSPPPYSEASASSPPPPPDGANDEGEGPEAYRAGDEIWVWSNSRRSWVEGVAEVVFTKDTRAEGFSVPAGTVKVAFAGSAKWIMAGEVSRLLRPRAVAASRQRCRFAQGDAVEVWSNTRTSWLRGSVLEVFEADTRLDAFRVPAGTIRVCCAAGVKWVLPENIDALLRVPQGSVNERRAAQPVADRPNFARGDAVEIWSDSRRAWVSGVVDDLFERATRAEGFSVPAGAAKVVYEGGMMKWVLPDDFGRSLRRPPPDRGVATSVEDSPASSPTRRVASPLAVAPLPEFERTPERSVFDTQTSVETRSSTRTSPVRPLEGRASLDLRGRLAVALERPELLQEQVEALWYNLGCEGEDGGDGGGLPVEQVPGVLESLALQFGVRLDLEELHVASTREFAKAFARSTPGTERLKLPELCGLCRELITEVWRALDREAAEAEDADP